MTTTTYFQTSSRNLLFAGIAATVTALAIAAVPTPASAKAFAAAPATAAAWQVNVEKQIDATLQMPSVALANRDHAIAQVRVRFNAEGEARSITLAQSSGDEAVDAEALRTAHAVRYPLLPVSLRGQNRSIVMQVYLADGTSATHAQEAKDLQLAAHRSAEQMPVQTAALEK